MLLRIRHDTAHGYGLAPDWVAQVVRLTPRDGPHQRVLAWSVRDEGQDPPLSFLDGYGNLCHLFTRTVPGRASRIVAAGEVETLASPQTAAAEAMPVGFYRRETALTAPSEAIRRFAQGVRAGVGSEADAASEILALATGVCERIAHEKAATTVATSAGESFASGGGVCQDRTHILISAARVLGHPARYVSGYWHGAPPDEDGAMHAWAEVWQAAIGWLAVDPSSGELVRGDHVCVAVGLDYEGAAPLRGVRKGGADERLAVRVEVASVASAPSAFPTGFSAGGPARGRPPAVESQQ